MKLEWNKTNYDLKMFLYSFEVNERTRTADAHKDSEAWKGGGECTKMVGFTTRVFRFYRKL